MSIFFLETQKTKPGVGILDVHRRRLWFLFKRSKCQRKKNKIIETSIFNKEKDKRTLDIDVNIQKKKVWQRRHMKTRNVESINTNTKNAWWIKAKRRSHKARFNLWNAYKGYNWRIWACISFFFIAQTQPTLQLINQALLQVLLAQDMKFSFPFEAKKKKMLSRLKTRKRRPRQKLERRKKKKKKKKMDGPNTNQICLGNMNCHKKFKPEAHFLVAVIPISLRDFNHTSPN